MILNPNSRASGYTGSVKRNRSPGAGAASSFTRALAEPKLAMTMLAALCGAALLAALLSQHVWDIRPCPWCTLQRLIVALVAVAAILSANFPHGRYLTRGRIAAGAAFLLACAGIAAALWQHFVAARSNACGLTFADRFMQATRLPDMLPAVFAAKAPCGDVTASLGGVPYEFWSLLLFFACAAIAWHVFLATED